MIAYWCIWRLMLVASVMTGRHRVRERLRSPIPHRGGGLVLSATTGTGRRGREWDVGMYRAIVARPSGQHAGIVAMPCTF
jgi:hypothetical protein